MHRLTIGMPVFNDIHFIEASLKSILDQNFSDFKLLISDDGSTDGSADICIAYASKDDRIEYIRQPKNLGISKNMMYLLHASESEYFMWAADDDLWDPEFCSTLIHLLDSSKDAVCAFSDYNLINEKGDIFRTKNTFNYKAATPYKRLKKFILNADDGFGYGVFRTNEIREVEFPVWWWPNKASAYNNIYPTLCFYLAKGPYLHYSLKTLFHKREKTPTNTHHVITGSGNAIKETFSYIIRRFNLVIFSSKLIIRATNLQNAIFIFPTLFYKWFLVSSAQQLKLAGKSFFRNRILRQKKSTLFSDNVINK